MELDFKSIKALSSPTRLKILRKVLEDEATTTQLSDEIGKSKSTVSSHLKELTEAGLLEKDKKEGRRRVVYKPTRKADAIVQGKERKVKFSVASSVLSAAGGTFLIWKDLASQKIADKSPDMMAESGDSGIGAMSMEAGNMSRDTAEAASQSSGEPIQILLFAGIGLLTFSLSTLVYGLAINHLGPEGSNEGENGEKVEVK